MGSPLLAGVYKKHAKTEDTMKHFSAIPGPGTNKTQGYERFRNVSRYLRECLAKTDHLEQVMSFFFTEDDSNISDYIDDLIAVRRNIPLVFLEGIGADINEIIRLNERDNEDFLQMKASFQGKPRYALIRYMATVYKSVAFPSEMNENDAIAYAQRYFCKKKFRCQINYPELKTIFIEPDGNY